MAELRLNCIYRTERPALFGRELTCSGRVANKKEPPQRCASPVAFAVTTCSQAGATRADQLLLILTENWFETLAWIAINNPSHKR